MRVCVTPPKPHQQFTIVSDLSRGRGSPLLFPSLSLSLSRKLSFSLFFSLPSYLSFLPGQLKNTLQNDTHNKRGEATTPNPGAAHVREGPTRINMLLPATCYLTLPTKIALHFSLFLLLSSSRKRGNNEREMEERKRNGRKFSILP